MVGKFDVFITIDNNLPHQQQLSQTSVAYIVLMAHNNKLETLKPLMAKVLVALETIQNGSVIEIHPDDE